METEGVKIRTEQTIAVRYSITGIPLTSFLRIIILIGLFMGLCVVVFAGEPGSPDCDLQTGLPATLNLSREQCEKIQQLEERFRNDTTATRGKIIEKRLELKRLSRNPKIDPYAVDKAERELNALEQALYREAHRTEAGQRRFLDPEQIDKIRAMPNRYDSQGYGRRGYWRQ